MRVLVAYASRHGATKGIAERVATVLEGEQLEVTLRAIDDDVTLEGYEAAVIGAAAYAGRWLGDAARFVRRHRDALATRPVWMFSSGPVGTETVDSKGRDVVAASAPSEFAEFGEAIRPRDRRVFFGAYDPDDSPANVYERLAAPFLRLPAVRAALPAGDFRDWPAIEAWARSIASDLKRGVALEPTSA